MMPGMTGGSLPASIWRAYMKPYMAARPVQNFELAYSKALSDTDFITYNIKNLSDKESANGVPSHDYQDGEMQTDPNLDPLAGGEGTPNAPVAPNAPSADDVNNGSPDWQGDRNPGTERPLPSDDSGRSPIAPADNAQPSQQQPMPGYGSPPTGGNSSGRSGYNVIPIDRNRRGARINPPSTESPDDVGAPLVPVPGRTDTRSRG
jgi:hypothetical protein